MNKKHWEEQPRHPAGSPQGGQWSTSGGIGTMERAMRDGAGTHAAYSHYNDHVRDELQRVDHFLSDLPHEHVFVTGPETGDALFDHTSREYNSVSISGRKAIEFQHAAANAIVTHNHPGDDAPFSGNDLYSAIKSNVQVTRVVGKNVIHEMRANKYNPMNFRSWLRDSDALKFGTSWTASTMDAMYEIFMLKAAVKYFDGDPDYSWRQLPWDQRADLMKIGMTDLAKFMNWEYTVYDK